MIYVRDFKSHSIVWWCDENDTNEDTLDEWIILNYLHRIYSSNDKGMFCSARWQKDYIPDISIISRSTLNDNTMATRQVLVDFFRSQHGPVIIRYGLQIPIVRSIPKPRWNFRHADWKKYAEELDHLIQLISSGAKNCDSFVGGIKTVAIKHIPRGFRKTFIPTWDKNCEKLFEISKKQGITKLQTNFLKR